MPEEKTITTTEKELKESVSEIVKSELEVLQKTLSDDLRREIKSHQTPEGMTPQITVKNEFVDKHIFGTLARLEAKSRRDRTKFTETVETIKDSYLRNAIDKIMTFASSTEGGFLVPTQYSPIIIESLKAQSVIRSAGVQLTAMPNNNVSFRKWHDGSGEASWESETIKPTAIDGATSMLTLTGKKLIAEVEVSSELVNDTTGQADMQIQEMLIYKIASKEDKTFLTGSGVGNIPKGIITGASTSTAMTATPTFAKAKSDIIGLVKSVRGYNVPFIKPAFVISPATYYALIAAEAPNNSTADFFKGLRENVLFGYPVYVTTNIPDTNVLFGDFQMAMIGQTQGITVTSSTEYKFGEDITVVKAITREDFGLLHDQAFAVLTGVTWSTALA